MTRGQKKNCIRILLIHSTDAFTDITSMPTKFNLYNFADDNTITSTFKGFNDLLRTLEKVTERTGN